MASETGIYNVQLNNYLQKIKKVNSLTWYERSEGPQQNLSWIITAIIDGEEKGEGKAAKKWQAKDIAAKRVLENLGVI